MHLILTRILFSLRVGISNIQNTFHNKSWNKTGVQNYAVIIPIKSSCIERNNKKLTSLQRYEIALNYKILHKGRHLF
jgi:hypothetical protein